MKKKEISKDQRIGHKPDSGFLGGLFKWKLNDEELKYQIENYDTLGFWGSSRGFAALFLVFGSFLTLLFLPESAIFALLAFLLAYFIYQGQMWAIVTTMILFTLDKIVTLIYASSIPGSSFSDVAIVIFWWALFMGQFWKAYQVEKEKEHFNSSIDEKILDTGEIKSNKDFYRILRQDPKWSQINKKFLAELSNRFDTEEEVNSFLELTQGCNFQRDIIPFTLDSGKNKTGVDIIAFVLQDTGCSLIQSGRYNQGIRSLNLALRICPTITSSYGMLALAYYEIREYREALEYSTKWLDSPITGSKDVEGYNPVISDTMKKIFNSEQRKAELKEMKRRLNIIKNDCLKKLSEK